VPAPKPDEVLIRVLAAGVNRPDVAHERKLSTARRGQPDHRPGGRRRGGGDRRRGAAVPCRRPCVCADQRRRLCGILVAPAPQTLPWPAGYDAIRAAALPETYSRFGPICFMHGRLARGESALIHGGTSGIGVTAIQLAKEFGASVYATAGSDAKTAACLKLGADGAINYRTADFLEEIKRLTGGRGVDVVLDMVGAPYFARTCAARDGRPAGADRVPGGLEGRNFDLTPVMTKRLTITGSTMRPRTTAQKGKIAASCARACGRRWIGTLCARDPPGFPIGRGGGGTRVDGKQCAYWENHAACRRLTG